jgi:hypothetical protein
VRVEDHFVRLRAAVILLPRDVVGGEARESLDALEAEFAQMRLRMREIRLALRDALTKAGGP